LDCTGPVWPRPEPSLRPSTTRPCRVKEPRRPSRSLVRSGRIGLLLEAPRRRPRSCSTCSPPSACNSVRCWPSHRNGDHLRLIRSGRLTVSATSNRDCALEQGCLLRIDLTYVLANSLTGVV
jgi:hypothetical protein